MNYMNTQYQRQIIRYPIKSIATNPCVEENASPEGCEEGKK